MSTQRTIQALGLIFRFAARSATKAHSSSLMRTDFTDVGGFAGMRDL